MRRAWVGLVLALFVGGCGLGTAGSLDPSTPETSDLTSPYAGKVIINEVLAHEVNGDARTEFVELVNLGTTSVDLSGWKLADGAMVRHTFAAGTTLAPQTAIVVFGGASAIGSTPNAVAASTGALGLNNSSADSVKLTDKSGASVDSMAYSTAPAAGVSLNRSPDATAGASWAVHPTINGKTSSPGTRVDGSPFRTATDGGALDGGATDGGHSDGGATDAGAFDGGPTDAGFDGGAVDAGFDGGSTDAGAFDGGTLHVRIAAGNISSGNNQSYDPGEGIRIFRGLHPDIALIQEFNYGTGSDADIRRMIDQAFGTDYSYCRETGGVQIPNGVASRFPIEQCGEWKDTMVSNRDFTWARISLPTGQHLWAISVHLLTSSATSRQTEAGELVDDIKGHVPAGDFVVLGGDFNTGSETEAAITTLHQVFDTAAPWPVDQNNNKGTNASRAKHYDWVLTDTRLRQLEVPVRIGGSSYPSGLVFDSRVYTPLAEVSPILAGDSAATNMQHMAVVRDFAVRN